ncbi:hypothetical protein [Rubrivivax sp. A210]|uniref:hypothetical protein n=1 Tax=Rubrivivax sp. A210 TaxID=2772301 RepID=UPI00191A6D52|nr:hypothetical protein [Rubrivivax sp. A210]
MAIHAWMIKSLPVCECYLPGADVSLPRFLHCVTHVRPERDAEGRRVGETVWFSRISGQDAAAAWEWTEARPGIVVLSDPNCMSTNVRFVGAEDVELPHVEQLVVLNRIVHGLPWQGEVCQAITVAGRETKPGPTARPARGAADVDRRATAGALRR